MMESDSSWVNFSLGEDIRNENRLAQDQQWKNAIVDGRKHISHREANQFHSEEFLEAIENYVTVKMVITSPPHCFFSKLSRETLHIILDFAFTDHGKLVPFVLDSMWRMEKGPSLKGHSSFRVCLRKRPLNSHEVEADSYDSISTSSDLGLLTLHDGKKARNGRRLSMSHRNYYFDRVWDHTVDNDQVCRDEIDDLISCAKDGRSGTLLCFGQTGTGKTYTLSAALDRVAEQLTDKVVEVSFFEIHGKKCFDLLNQRRVVHLRADENEEVHVRGGRVVVVDARVGANGSRVDPAQTLARLLASAMRQRSSEVTERNPISSRSHAVCIIKILTDPPADTSVLTPSSTPSTPSKPRAVSLGDWLIDHSNKTNSSNPSLAIHDSADPCAVYEESPVPLLPDPTSEKESESDSSICKQSQSQSPNAKRAPCVFGKITLVDLAGSERNYETVQMSREQHRESAEINSALMALKDCFRAFSALQRGRNTMLRHPNAPRCLLSEHDEAPARPPFRASLLTRVLKECFDPTGGHRTVIIATVSPSPVDLMHSINTIEHVLLMAPHLNYRTTSATVELPIKGAALSHVPVDKWTPDQLNSWLALADKGRFARLVLPPDMDGLGLLRLNEVGLTALFEGQLRTARQDGEGEAWVEAGEESRGHVVLARALWGALRREQQAAQNQAKNMEIPSFV